MTGQPTLDEVRKLVGQQLPGGSFTIQPYEHWLFTDVVLSPPLPPGVAHPIYAYRVAMAGMGLSIDEMFQLGQAAGPDKVMFGETDMEVRRPLLVGETYAVRGGITGVERHTGRRAGIFDLITFRLEVVTGQGEVAAVCTNSLVFMRGA